MTYSPVLDLKAISRASPMFVFAAMNVNPFASQSCWRNSREPSVDRPSTMMISSSSLMFASRDEAQRWMVFAEFRLEMQREYLLICNSGILTRDFGRRLRSVGSSGHTLTESKGYGLCSDRGISPDSQCIRRSPVSRGG